MNLIINNLQKKVEILPQWEANLQNIVRKTLALEGVNSGTEISLVFVDDEEIQKLNNTYRNKDMSTDVLSFPLCEDVMDEQSFLEVGQELLLGDIVISLETAARQAEEYGHSLEREVAYLMLHGLLHLLGYDHLDAEEKTCMRAREEEILASLNLNR